MAKKKIKKLLKKALPLLAIAGLGKAFMNRNARASTDADAIKAMTQDSAYSLDELPKGVTLNERNVDVPMSLGRMEGKGDMSGSVGQKIRADYAQKMRNAVTGVDGSPAILNPFNDRVITGRLGNRGNTFKKGGKVKKGGRAVRKANRSKKK
jgi:hypothetical protein